MSYAGQPLKRREDPRLLTGHGSFVDDIQLPVMLYAYVLRSPHAHARLKSIDVEADGLYAVCIQHEMDHLIGKVFLDRMTDLSTLTQLSEFEKFWRKEPTPVI